MRRKGREINEGRGRIDDYRIRRDRQRGGGEEEQGMIIINGMS